MREDYDLSTDLAVVGFGYAGGVAAIEAANQRLEAMIFEKMPMPGGISICSGGGVRVANQADRAFAYLRETCGGLTPDPVLEAMASGMVEARDVMEEFATANDALLREVEFPGNYPFAGYDEMGFVMFGQIPGFDQLEYYPHARGLRGGARHFKVIEDNVRARNIPVQFESAVRDLIVTPDRRVTGIFVRHQGRDLRVQAKRGVVLACGGFEANEWLKRQFVCSAGILSAAFLGNTGDGIRMAQSVGADLWHMTNVHGTYGFRHADPDYPLAIRLYRLPDWNVEVPLRAEAVMSWIVVDQHGRRYMNEYPPYMQDTGHRAMLKYDDQALQWPRIPSMLIFDERGREMYPLAIPAFNDPEVGMSWSDDNLTEVDLGILKRADSLEELACQFGLPPANLIESVNAWNRQIARGEEDPFGRLPATRVPIDKPPFYGGMVWPIVSNTQGGPVHDEHWRVLDVAGEPIVGLYEAGELGGIWGHLYLAGGNLAECYVGGLRAARHAATMEPAGS